MTSAQIGGLLGPIFGIGGAVGSFAGGYLTDHFGKTDKSWYLKIPAYAIALVIPLSAGAIFLHDRTLSIICLGLTASLQSMYLPLLLQLPLTIHYSQLTLHQPHLAAPPSIVKQMPLTNDASSDAKYK